MSKKRKPRRLKRRVRTQAGTKKQPAGQYREGDGVRVKPGTACPDAPDLDLSGWQGRVTNLTQANDTSDPTIGFAWDSIFPLADLASVDENSPNAQPTQDYRGWFANR